MAEDKLIKHSRAEKRERPNALEEWLQGNCVKAVSHEEVRRILNSKKDNIEKLLAE